MPLPDKLNIESLPPKTIPFIANRYLAKEVLGVGSFGCVFLVTDVKQPTAVLRAAKKIQLPISGEGEQNEELTIAIREAQVLSDLHHPHIVQLCDAVLEKSNFYIIMEYCQHGALESYIQQLRNSSCTMKQKQVVCWLVQLTDALCYIHSKRILHRDLKSRNIFLSERGEGTWSDLKVGDFGISRILCSSTDKATTITGTPFYLCPELLQQLPYDKKSDAWALGCLLFEMCTLTTPFNTTEGFSDLMKQIVYDEPDYKQVPKHLRSFQVLCEKLLDKSPITRFSAEDVLHSSLCESHIKNHTSRHEYCQHAFPIQLPLISER